MQQFLFLQSAVQICLRGVAGRRGQGPGRLRPEVGWRCYEHGSASFPRPKAKSSGLASAILQSLVRPDRVVFDGPMEQSFGQDHMRSAFRFFMPGRRRVRHVRIGLIAHFRAWSIWELQLLLEVNLWLRL